MFLGTMVFSNVVQLSKKAPPISKVKDATPSRPYENASVEPDAAYRHEATWHAW
jgi:hypothetical protein